MIYFDAFYVANFYLTEADSATVIAFNVIGTFKR